MKYSLGLDIGTTSVGWAVINEDKKRIEDLGVRIFETPEDPQTGKSLATPRRTKRSMRRRIKRRRQRLNYLKKFFVEKKLLSEEEIAKVFAYEKGNDHKDPYLLREKAIKEKVENDELFVALYHIAKRRGYKSNRKKVEENDKESGRVLKAISENKPLLAKYDNSIAEVLNKDEKFSAHKRNKADSYANSFIREDFEQEIRKILETQGWSEEWIRELLDSNPVEIPGKAGLFYQRPFMTSELINRMRGKCEFEKDELRAPKASYSFEIFRLASDLVHVTYNNGEKLTVEEISACVEKAKVVASFKYSTLRKTIGRDKDENFKFDYYRGKKKETEKEQEENKFGELKFYHDVEKALKDLPEEWARICGDTDLFDKVGEVLTCNKDDEAVERGLKDLGLSGAAIDKLAGLSYSKFGHLSFKALKKITPHILSGMTYHEAVEVAYPGESKEKLSGDKNQLPKLSEEELQQLTNPVVKRAISQTRKVVNAVIRKHGAPTYIKIECANELAKSSEERKAIEKEQKENQARNEARKDELIGLGATSPSGQQIIKCKLYEQQNGQCVYCGAQLNIGDIVKNEKVTEVDHIIPFSRSGVDSLNNKVLVCARCNQEKRDRTPFEAWGGDKKKWEGIVARANANFSQGKLIPKRNRILTEKLPEEGWNERALNDTRYVMRFMANYIKKNLKFAEDGERKQKVLLPTGFITSYTRKILGLSKDRDENNCHHAVDACIIGILSQGQIQKFAVWNKYKELGARYRAVTFRRTDGEIEEVTKEKYEKAKANLAPWKDFAKEVRIRSGMSYDKDRIEKLADFRDKFRDFESYDEDFLNQIHPMFVSRMPKRSVAGAAHEDTARSPKEKDGGYRLSRLKLEKLTLEKLEKSVLKESDKVLYEQLVGRLEKFGGDAEKAFAEPIYKNNKKFDKNGKHLSRVTTIKVYDKKPMTSGILINKGTQYVDNGSMACIDIYKRKNAKGEDKFYITPVYVHSLRKEKLPILPVFERRSKEEKEDLNEILETNGQIFATKENGFELVMRVFPNDYLKIYHNNGIIKEGYYVKYGSASGQISLISHNQAQKDVLLTATLGKVKKIEKIDISVLGDNYKFE